jgi:hypothetical protein
MILSEMSGGPKRKPSSRDDRVCPFAEELADNGRYPPFAADEGLEPYVEL